MAKVAASEDIVKHVKSTLVEGEWIDGIAFLPRLSDGDGSSVHRLRIFSNDDDEAMVDVRRVSRLTLRPSHRFAQVNVGDFVQAVAEFAQVSVISDPLPAQKNYPQDPSHALIRDLPPVGLLDDLIGDMIRRAVKRVHQAV